MILHPESRCVLVGQQHGALVDVDAGHPRPGNGPRDGRPIRPYPQPRSRISPFPGGSVSRNSTDVPMSPPPLGEDPGPGGQLEVQPPPCARTGTRLKATDGSAVK